MRQIIPIYIDDDYHLQKDIDYLGDTVEEIISEYDTVEFSVYFKDLSSDQTLIINDEPMYPCSIIKIGVMASVFMQIAEGNLYQSGGTGESGARKIHDEEGKRRYIYF